MIKAISNGEMQRELTRYLAMARWWHWGHKYMLPWNKRRKPGKYVHVTTGRKAARLGK